MEEFEVNRTKYYMDYDKYKSTVLWLEYKEFLLFKYGINYIGKILPEDSFEEWKKRTKNLD